ncbi:MAG TPA: cytochrome c maturation protein CcmE [Gemmatimonadaceae bacterium]
MSDAKGRKRATLAVAVVIVLAAFGYLLLGGLGENIVYFLTPEELLARGTTVYDVPVRLGGQVKPGSVQWDAESLDLRFEVTDGKATVPVHSTGAPPQMFRDGMGVVIEGRLRPEGVFQSNELMVMHSNEYRAPKPGETPRDMYKTLIKETGR